MNLSINGNRNPDPFEARSMNSLHLLFHKSFHFLNVLLHRKGLFENDISHIKDDSSEYGRRDDEIINYIKGRDMERLLRAMDEIKNNQTRL